MSRALIAGAWLLVTAGVLLTGSAEGAFCCTPSQWSATVRTLLQEFPKDDPSSVTHTSTWQTVAYDASHKRMAFNVFLKDGVNTYSRHILDYSEGVHYVIEGKQQQTCVHHPLTSPFKPVCARDGNKGLYFAGIGGIGENTVYFADSDITGYVTITIVDCALVQEVTYETSGNAVVSKNVQFMNQTLTLDPAAFTLPPSCHGNQTIRAHEEWVDDRTLVFGS